MTIVLHNPTDAPITDYPIQDPGSKEVLLWTINPGQTLEFPQHVGKYLLEVYGFLQEVMTEEQHAERKEEEKKVQEGRAYTQVRIVKGEGEIVNAAPVDDPNQPKQPAAGFTNETMQPHNAPVAKTDSVLCPDCQASFGTLKIMQNHYKEKHVETT